MQRADLSGALLKNCVSLTVENKKSSWASAKCKPWNTDIYYLHSTKV